MAVLFQATGTTTALLPTTTWAAPNALFPTTDRNDGTAYTWSSSTSTVTLPSSGLADGYLFVWGYEFHDTSDGRHNPQGRMIQASGTGNFASASTGGYNRDTSEDRSYVSGWSFVDTPSASATFTFQWRRDADIPTGGTERSYIQAIPLYYADAGIYTSTSTTATGGTTPVQITGLSGTDGTNITITTDTVSVTGDNKRYLVLGSVYHQSIGNARTQRWYGLRVDGTKDDAAKGAMFYRDASNADGGSSFMRLLETVTATRTVDLFQYRGDGVGAGQGGADVDGNTTGANSSHALVVLELNDAAEVFSSTDSVGGQEFALAGPVDVDIASTGDIEFNDAASFTRSTDAGVNAEQAMDVLAFANVSHAREASSIGSGLRWTVHGEFTLDGTEQTGVGFHGNYNRGNQTTQDTHGSSTNQAAFFAVTSGQDIGVSNQELAGSEGGGGDIETQAGWVGFGLLNLDTLEAAAADYEADALLGQVNVQGFAPPALTEYDATGLVGQVNVEVGAKGADLDFCMFIPPPDPWEGEINHQGFIPTIDAGGAVEYNATGLLGQVNAQGFIPTVTTVFEPTAAQVLGETNLEGFIPTTEVVYAPTGTGLLGETNLEGFIPTVEVVYAPTGVGELGEVNAQGFIPTTELVFEPTAAQVLGEVNLQGFIPTIGLVFEPTAAQVLGEVNVEGFIPTVEVVFTPTAAQQLGEVHAEGFVPTIGLEVDGGVSSILGEVNAEGFAPTISGTAIQGQVGEVHVETAPTGPDISFVLFIPLDNTGEAQAEGFIGTVGFSGATVSTPLLGETHAEGFAPTVEVARTAAPEVGEVHAEGFAGSVASIGEFTVVAQVGNVYFLGYQATVAITSVVAAVAEEVDRGAGSGGMYDELDQQLIDEDELILSMIQEFVRRRA